MSAMTVNGQTANAVGVGAVHGGESAPPDEDRGVPAPEVGENIRSVHVAKRVEQNVDDPPAFLLIAGVEAAELAGR